MRSDDVRRAFADMCIHSDHYAHAHTGAADTTCNMKAHCNGPVCGLNSLWWCGNPPLFTILLCTHQTGCSGEKKDMKLWLTIRLILTPGCDWNKTGPFALFSSHRLSFPLCCFAMLSPFYVFFIYKKNPPSSSCLASYSNSCICFPHTPLRMALLPGNLSTTPLHHHHHNHHLPNNNILLLLQPCASLSCA